MTPTLAATAFLMGLAGGPHCIAMCGAACGALVRGARRPPGEREVKLVPRTALLQGAGGVPAVDVAPAGAAASAPSHGMWAFQAGRLLGYSAAGAAAGLAVQGFAWLSTHTAALKPLWTFFHVAVLAWGLMLLARARQPAWVERTGRAVWARVQPLVATRGGLVGAGALWAFMPCGLLYSALLVASLAGGALQGAASMALFALGSGISLGLAPTLLRRLQRAGNQLRQDWGTRVAGGLLALVAAWALWHDVVHPIAVWCGLA